MKPILLFAFAAATLAAQTPAILGDWQGALKVGPDQIHLALHITAGENGALKATMDSPDQAVNGLAVTSITLKDSKLTLAVEVIHATYQANVNAAITSIEGTWSQGQPMPLTFTRPAKSSGTASTSEIDGIWQGTLEIGGAKLRLVFHLATTASGLSATMDSPDQGATALPVASARREGSTLTLQMPSLGARFQGVIAPDLSAIEGTFTQGGASLPLILKPR